jgi:dTMP kinase
MKEKKMGLLITIEANDGSGKETQSKRLFNRLIEEGHRVKLVSFPNYESEASALVKMYLKGDFGSSADEVSPYAASVFFAVDRYASFKKEWQSFYESGGIVIADRYTTANMVHQATKFDKESDMDAYLNWLEDFEYQLMGIPRPDITFFLDVPVEHSLNVIASRANKIDGTQTKDIHERDEDHVKRAYECALKVTQKRQWIKIECMVARTFRAIDLIHEDIYKHVLTLFERKL